VRLRFAWRGRGLRHPHPHVCGWPRRVPGLGAFASLGTASLASALLLGGSGG